MFLTLPDLAKIYHVSIGVVSITSVTEGAGKVFTAVSLGSEWINMNLHCDPHELKHSFLKATLPKLGGGYLRPHIIRILDHPFNYKTCFEKYLML